jgi:WD40 repeat protein
VSWCEQDGAAIPVRVLTGHKKRVFNVVWSPLLPNVLASGGDDRSVVVWDVTSGTSKVGLLCPATTCGDYVA